MVARFFGHDEEGEEWHSRPKPEPSYQNEFPSKPTNVNFPGHENPNYSGWPQPYPSRTLATSIKHITHATAHNEHGASSVPTRTSEVEKPTIVATVEATAGADASFWDGDHKGLKIAAGIAVPVALLAIAGFILLVLLRKRKRNKQVKAASGAQMAQMKNGRQSLVAAHYGNQSPHPSSTPPPRFSMPSAQPPYTAPPSQPPPVMLGPIVPGSNGAYFTGIDTSDDISMNDHRPGNQHPDRIGLGNPFADSNSLTDEPPPPYRPRSLAPISRDSSLRGPPPTFEDSTTNLLAQPQNGTRQTQQRSPFADPDDDAISDLSGPTVHAGRHHDNMSAVSDLSYQQDPVVTRPAV